MIEEIKRIAALCKEENLPCIWMAHVVECNDCNQNQTYFLRGNVRYHIRLF